MRDELLTALSVTGQFLDKYCRQEDTGYPEWKDKLDLGLDQASLTNPWFIREFILTSLNSISSMLDHKQLTAWLTAYPQLIGTPVNPSRIGVISAGNIPLVGFHDFLCVILSGHTYLGKLSASDNILLPLIAGFIMELQPVLKEKIRFIEGKLEGFNAIIATGSNNTARYFDYYFRKYPLILRKNRNSIAIINGDETSEELELLADDIFLYFGLGCRNVSKILVPQGYDVTQLFPHWTRYSFFEHHNKYQNNYSYYKSIYLVNRDEHLDNGFILVKKEAERIASPVSVLFIEEYPTLEYLHRYINQHSDQIQCIIGKKKVYNTAIPFGDAQSPGVAVYADGVDTLQFLTELEDFE